MNIRIKLALTFTSIVILILVAFSVTVYEYYAIYRESNFYERLKEKAYFTAKILLDEDGLNAKSIQTLSRYKLDPLPEQNLCIYSIRNELVDCINQPIYQDENKVNLIRRMRVLETISNDTQYIGIEFYHPRGEYIVVSSAYDGVGFERLHSLRNLIITVLLLSMLFTGYAGWWFSNEALRPIQEVMREVDEITATSLHKRVKTKNSKDEITQLANTFNHMLQRIEHSFTLEKSFVANASHEYRTPLTAMKGQIEVALLQGRTKDEYLNLIRSLQEEIERMIHLQESLGALLRTTTERISRNFKPQPLLEIVADARLSLIQSKPDYHVAIHVSRYPDNYEEAMVMGDDPLLKSAFINLMDNGCKFSASHRVKVDVTYRDAAIIVSISDEGVGIPEEELGKIFEPFYRGNDIRTIYGHGLGLSLVQRIADLHGANITVTSAKGKGSVFTFVFGSIAATV